MKQENRGLLLLKKKKRSRVLDLVSAYWWAGLGLWGSWSWYHPAGGWGLGERVPGLVPDCWWVYQGAGVSGFRTLGVPELVSVCWLAKLDPEVSGYRAQGVLELVSALW